jgi:hypothetical protein
MVVSVLGCREVSVICKDQIRFLKCRENCVDQSIGTIESRKLAKFPNAGAAIPHADGHIKR